MYKTTALMLSLMLTSMPVLADCMAQLDRKTVAEQLSRSIDYLGPLPSDLNCVKPASESMALVCGNADLLSLPQPTSPSAIMETTRPTVHCFFELIILLPPPLNLFRSFILG